MQKPTILVVGGAGYNVSHMVLDLLEAGYTDVTIDNLSRGHRELLPRGEFVAGDIGNPDDVVQMYNKYLIKSVSAPRRKGDPAVLIADSSRIRGQLGWQPRYENIRDIIASAWDWHRKEAGL